MTRELFVSSTPHETKVGLVEDDLLAEIYLERENEYTLAGSIYKGRVTRVLPGMQSAFVDIGLERDAFLYVSDFMELEDSEDLDEVPASRPAPERYQAQPPAEAQGGEAFAAPVAEPQALEYSEAGPGNGEAPAVGESRDNRGSFRGRRRRRGRRGERMPESKFASPATEAPPEAPHAERPERTERPERPERPERHDRTQRPEFSDRGGRSERPARTDRPERSEYGPPPGYQPIILPGESISKYRGLNQSRPAPPNQRPTAPSQDQDQPPRPIAEIFSDDEPIFATAAASPSASVPPVEPQAQAHEEAPAQLHNPPSDDSSAAWDREQQRLHQMNVAAVFGGEVGEDEDDDQEAADESDAKLVVVAEPSEAVQKKRNGN